MKPLTSLFYIKV